MAIGVLGNRGYVDETPFRGLPGVRELIHVTKPYKLVSRDFHPQDGACAIPWTWGWCRICASSPTSR